MIRLSLLVAYVLFLAVYAWKDWYRALCGLILLTAVIEHPDMPKTLFGIQGLNVWNLLLLAIVAAWALSRRREKLEWDLPRHVELLLTLYLLVVLVGFVRLLADPGGLFEVDTTAGIWSEYLVNTIKWVVPGFLLFDGARTRERFLLGLLCGVAVYVIIGVQVIKWMPPGTVLSGADLSARSLKILQNEVGYHRVNLSMMLGGASWAVFALHVLPRRLVARLGVLLLAATMLYAQALTGGRTGYATWFAVGLALCTLRWRRYLLLVPVVVVGVVLLVPGTVERMTQGFSPETEDRPAVAQGHRDGSVDDYTVTAGRTLIWPYVIAKIKESPNVGYGREAMQRTGLALFLWQELQEVFPHPHNAYFEMLLDNGWIGFVLVMPFYAVVVFHSVSLLRDSRSMLFVATGGACLALVLALLVASVGSQTFYPREGAVGMWCAIGMVFRAKVLRARAEEVAARAAEAEAGDSGGADSGSLPSGGFSSRLRRPTKAPSLDPFLWSETA